MILEFLPKALDVYKSVKELNPEKADKIKGMLKDILSHPSTGTGECPIKLEGKYEGVWARKISFNESLYYVFNEERVLIICLSLQKETSHLSSIIDKPFSLDSFSAEEYKSVMALMSANRGKDSEPKVGIFWYNRARNELFGVISHKLSDYDRANASDGRITCSEMHEDVWKREFRKQKYHSDGNGPFIGAYQDKPRGRVFYNIETETFEVAVGKWIEEYPQAYELILEEFNLPKDKTSAKYAIHWDIGMSWR